MLRLQGGSPPGSLTIHTPTSEGWISCRAGTRLPLWGGRLVVQTGGRFLGRGTRALRAGLGEASGPSGGGWGAAGASVLSAGEWVGWGKEECLGRGLIHTARREWEAFRDQWGEDSRVGRGEWVAVLARWEMRLLATPFCDIHSPLSLAAAPSLFHCFTCTSLPAPGVAYVADSWYLSLLALPAQARRANRAAPLSSQGPRRSGWHDVRPPTGDDMFM